MYYSPNPATQAKLDSHNRSFAKLMAGKSVDEQIYWENRRQLAIRGLNGEDRIRTCGTEEVQRDA